MDTFQAHVGIEDDVEKQMSAFVRSKRQRRPGKKLPSVDR